MVVTSETMTPCYFADSTNVTDKCAAPPKQIYMSANLHDITSEQKAVFLFKLNRSDA